MPTGAPLCSTREFLMRPIAGANPLLRDFITSQLRETARIGDGKWRRTGYSV